MIFLQNNTLDLKKTRCNDFSTCALGPGSATCLQLENGNVIKFIAIARNKYGITSLDTSHKYI